VAQRVCLHRSELQSAGTGPCCLASNPGGAALSGTGVAGAEAGYISRVNFQDATVAKTATITTSKGTITAELFEQEVPNTVQNFEKLANSQFYDGTRFHRVISNFMIQGGDPLSKDPNNPRVGTGGPGYKIKCETHLNTHKHTAGTLSMAHAGKDTGGSQFFICHSPQPHLDKVHTVFGQVTGGMDVVNQIRQNDVITSIRVN
jgi:peptidyl-prolyl cis-trans isomerase B (cyclophilin B)